MCLYLCSTKNLQHLIHAAVEKIEVKNKKIVIWKVWAVQSEAALFTKAICSLRSRELQGPLWCMCAEWCGQITKARGTSQEKWTEFGFRTARAHFSLPRRWWYTRVTFSSAAPLSNSLWLGWLCFFPFSFRRTRGYWFPHLLWHIAEMIFIAVSARARHFFCIHAVEQEKMALAPTGVRAARLLCGLRVCFAG
jgi:hypothetical protein